MNSKKKAFFFILGAGVLSGLFYQLISFLSFSHLDNENFSYTLLLDGSHFYINALYVISGGIISGLSVLLYNFFIGPHDYGHEPETLSGKNVLTEDNAILIRQIWPSLNVVRSGVDLVADGDEKLTESKRREVIKITQKNMKEIFELFDTIAKSHGSR